MILLYDPINKKNETQENIKSVTKKQAKIVAQKYYGDKTI